MAEPGAALRKVVLSRPVEVRLRAAPPVGRPAPAPGRRAELHHLLHARPRRHVLRGQPRAPGRPARDPGVEPPPGRHRAPGRHRPGRRRRPARPGRVGQEPRGAPLRRRRDRRHPGALLRRAVGAARALRWSPSARWPTSARGSRGASPDPSVCSSSSSASIPRRPWAAPHGPTRWRSSRSTRPGDARPLGRPGGLGRCRRRRRVDDRHPQRPRSTPTAPRSRCAPAAASWPTRTPTPRRPRRT